MKIKYIPIIIMAMLSTTTAADGIRANGKTIRHLGVEATNNLYFTISEGLPTICKGGGYIYADITSDFGKAAYSTLLMAKASGKLLSRLEYIQSADGEQCTLTLVEVEN